MRKKITGILLLICLITGCTQEERKSEDYQSPFGIEPDLSYEVPVTTPGVMINTQGYDTKGKKSVTFYGKSLAQTFEVIDDTTGEVVYNGKIKTYDTSKNNAKTLGYGYFSELQKIGTYYIRTDIIGESYSFQIKDHAQSSLFAEISRESCQVWKEQGQKREVFNALVPALFAVELYGQVQKDDLGIEQSNNGIPDVLDGMKECIDLWKVKKPEEFGDVKMSLTAAGIFAKFSNIYRMYDAVYAAECTRLAEQLWYYSIKEIKENPEISYFAAAELYKATGYEKYHTIIKENTLEENRFFGDITYLSTRRKVDMPLCNEIMKVSMEQADAIFEKKGDSIYLSENDDLDAMLKEVMQLGVVDHIVTSHEYLTIIENQLNYLSGCNQLGKNHIEELRTNTGFFFMMSAIMENNLTREE